jgi:hypothetical protein
MMGYQVIDFFTGLVDQSNTSNNEVAYLPTGFMTRIHAEQYDDALRYARKWPNLMECDRVRVPYAYPTLHVVLTHTLKLLRLSHGLSFAMF